MSILTEMFREIIVESKTVSKRKNHIMGFETKSALSSFLFAVEILE
jgi:hypothetical protein